MKKIKIKVDKMNPMDAAKAAKGRGEPIPPKKVMAPKKGRILRSYLSIIKSPAQK